MEFEWNPNKNEANLQKHGIDFEDAAKVLLEPHAVSRSDRFGERRWLAVGPLEGEIVTVVYTLRGKTYRLISARRASRNEREDYRKEVG